MHIQELVEILTKLGCVSMTKCESKKCSLFSLPPDTSHESQVLTEATILDEAGEIFVEPKVDGIIRLAKFTGCVPTDFFSCPCHT
jgi:hypothetical protein